MASSKVTPYPFPASILIRRDVEFGQVCRVSDTLVSIPDADRVQGRRTLHETRRVVIVQNDSTNYTRYPVVPVAPQAEIVAALPEIFGLSAVTE